MKPASTIDRLDSAAGGTGSDPLPRPPANWTDADTVSLKIAHEAIDEYCGLVSAEFVSLLSDPEGNRQRLGEIEDMDMQAATDRRALAGFNRRKIAKVADKYGVLVRAARSGRSP